MRLTAVECIRTRSFTCSACNQLRSRDPARLIHLAVNVDVTAAPSARRDRSPIAIRLASGLRVLRPQRDRLSPPESQARTSAHVARTTESSSLSGTAISAQMLMNKGKRSAAVYIHAECISNASPNCSRHLNELLDILLNPS